MRCYNTSQHSLYLYVLYTLARPPTSSSLRTTDRSFRYTLSRLCGINFPFLRDNLVPVSISDYPCLTQRLSNQSFSSVDSPLSPFLLLEQRCGMACQEMLRRPRHCRCSEAEDVLVPTPLLRNCSTANDISYR